MSRTIAIYVKTDEDSSEFLKRLSHIFEVEISPSNQPFVLGHFIKPDQFLACDVIDQDREPIYGINAYSLIIDPWGEYNPKRPFAETQGRVARYTFDVLEAYGQYPLLMLINFQTVRGEFNWPRESSIPDDDNEI